MLRLENVTNGCDFLESMLGPGGRGASGGEEEAVVGFPPLNPKVVMLQINPAVPPPVRVKSRGGEERDTAREEGAWGCSLSEAAHLMTKHGYALVRALPVVDGMVVLL
jgi:hypothetical protein